MLKWCGPLSAAGSGCFDSKHFCLFMGRVFVSFHQRHLGPLSFYLSRFSELVLNITTWPFRVGTACCPPMSPGARTEPLPQPQSTLLDLFASSFFFYWLRSPPLPAGRLGVKVPKLNILCSVTKRNEQKHMALKVRREFR